MCMLYIDNALSVRALQEMMSGDGEMVSFIILTEIAETTLWFLSRTRVIQQTKYFAYWH